MRILPLKPLGILFVILTASGPGSAYAQRAPDRRELPNFDRRLIPGAPPGAARLADVAALRRAVPRVRVDFDERLAGPSWVASTESFLTGPGGGGAGISAATLAAVAPGQPHRATRVFLHEHRGLFGFGPEALDQAHLQQDFLTPHSKMRTVVWEQRVDDIAVFEALLISHTTSRGELVNLSSHFLAEPQRAADAGRPNRRALEANPPVTAPEAVSLAAKEVGETVAASAVVPVPGIDKGADQRQRFRAPGLDDQAEARLVWLPLTEQAMRLCWQVVLTSHTRGEMFRVLVDAETGEVLVRHCLTAYLSDATYRVFTSDSPSPLSPGHPTPATNQPPLVSRTLVTLSALDTNASPAGWIDDGKNETIGNNVDAHTDIDANNVPDLPRPQGSPARVFDFTLDLAQAPGTYSSAAVVQLFYWNNFMHDKLYQLGFTEAARNFQSNNFGRGGLGNDAVQADAQDGSGSNNANFSTPSDGSPGRMQMFLFTGPTPDRDGDLDAEVVLHEYTHGLSNRRVGGGVGMSALQSGGLGEGWSDFYGLALLSQAGDDVNATYAAGGYLTYLLGGSFTQNYYYGIRRYPYSTDLGKNPLTFKDLDPAQASPHTGVPRSPVIGNTANEVHNMGELWCVTLWEARANLINQHGWAAGNQLILQLATDGMNLSPANPTYLQARDAILQADLVGHGGTNRNHLWTAFAKRGMGWTATSPASSTTTGVQESFDLPDDLNVTPTGTVAVNGQVGGPFTPSCQVYLLRNTGSNALSWVASTAQSWISLTPASGSLSPGASNTVNVCLTATVNTFTAGVYSASVVFSNTVSGLASARNISLDISPPRVLFFSLDTDPGWGRSGEWAFGKPAGLGGTSYGYHDPTAGATGTNVFGVNLNGDYSTTIGGPYYLTAGPFNFSGYAGMRLQFQRWLNSDYPPYVYETIDISTNGSTWFGIWTNGSSAVTDTAWKRVWYDVSAYADNRPNVYVRWGHRVGSGAFAYSGWNIDDVEFQGAPPQYLGLSLPASATEGAGTVVGTLSAWPVPTNNVVVTLVSGDSTEVTVPANVTIGAGQSNVTFNITIVNDTELDGPQTATISASSPGYMGAAGSITVQDNETATLSVSAPAQVTEGDAPFPCLAGVSAPPAANIQVALSCTSALQVPPTATILAGQTSAVFYASVIDDTKINGSRMATITAHVLNWTDGSAGLLVRDNETTSLTVVLPAFAREGDGTLPNAGSVRISGTWPVDLPVSLASDDTTELAVPAAVTIPAGQTAAYFNLSVVDDPAIDGAQTVTVGALAVGFSPGSRAMTIYDNESPPVPANPAPADLATNVVQTTGLSWTSGALPGEVISNEVYFGTSPVPGPAQLQGTTTNASWVLPRLAPLTTYYWQIVARKAGTTPGPVWRFTTRGVDHFDLSAVPSPQYVGAPFNLTVTARDAYETVVSNFNGTVSFRAQRDSGGTSSTIVITEWDPSTPDNIEFMNVAAAPVDIGNWQIHIYDSVSFPNPLPAFIVPSGTTVPAGGIFRLFEFGTAPGAYPNFYSGNNINWVNDLSSSPIAVLLRDSTGAMIDFICAGGATASAIVNPAPIPASQWTGAQVQGNPNSAYTTQRIGNCDSNIAANFVITTPTPGTLNANLTVPFTGGVVAIGLSPTNSTPFAGGVWTGGLRPLQPATNVVVRVDDQKGHTATSNPFDVFLQNDLSVTLTDAPDPVPLGGNVTYTVRVANTGPLPAPGVALTNVLPPGASFVSASASQGVCTNAGNVVSCDLGSIGPATNATVTIVAIANQGGNLTNVVTVYRADADPFPDNNTASAVTPVVLPTISINDINVLEANSGLSTATFTVTISPPAPQVTTLSFATANGTAVAPGDYQLTNGIVTFNPGQAAQSLVVTVYGDTQYEANETFTMNLSGATNATFARSQGVATIVNDDAMPAVSVGDATLLEGNIGTNYLIFPVTLSGSNGLAASVYYSTASGTAASGSDFLARSGTLTFAAGVTSNFISVPVLGDTQVEADEDFYVDLSSPGNLVLLKRESIGMIVNDDGRAGEVDHFAWGPVASPQYVNEPFAATLTALDAFNDPVSTFSGTANLSARSSSGQRTNTILVNPVVYSYSYSYYTCGYSFTPTNNLTVTHVRSYSGTKVSIWTETGTLLASQAVSGLTGVWTETALAIPLQLTAGTTYRVGVYAGSAYIYYSSAGPTTFPAGTINASYYYYGDYFPTSTSSIHWFFVDLRYTTGGYANVALSPAVAGPFTNGVWAGDITVPAPATNLVLRADDGNGHFGLNSPGIDVQVRNDISVVATDAPRPVCVGGNLTYSILVSNSGPNSASGVVLTNWLPPGATFVSAASTQGTCTQSGNLVTCDVGGLGASGSAQVTIVLTAAQSGNLTNQCSVSRAEAEGWLANNVATTITPAVALPSLSINDPSAREGNAGTTNLLFTIALWPPPAITATVNYGTANGTATTPNDYIATNGVVSFAPGETNRTVAVTVNGNGVYASTKTFYVNLSVALNAFISKGQGIGTIVNDDPVPTLSIDDVSVIEGNLVATSAVFKVTLSSPSSLTTTVSYSTVGGTATSGSDFAAASGTLTFPALTTNASVTVSVTGDLAIEQDEAFYLDLSGPANAALAKREGVGLILNDDGLPGQVDHFVWSPMAATQYVGEPFPATITALDAYNQPALAYAGPANLRATASGGGVTNNMLGNLIHSSSGSGFYTLGYAFTPSTNITVTAVRAYFGTKVSIWTDAGMLLAAQAVPSLPGTWVQTPLSTPLQLTAGSRYRVAAYTGGGNYYWRTDGVSTFPQGTINQSYQASGDVFPTLTDSIRWWFVDLAYVVGSPVTVPLTPTLSGLFTNGTWSGNLTVGTPGTNVVLQAEDGIGHNGMSEPMMVMLHNDLSVRMVDSPRPVTVGANLTYTITVSNTGPALATAVTLTNWLPAAASFVSAAASQGTCSHVGNLVACDLGTLEGASNATVTLVLSPSQPGNLTNQVAVYRAENDPLPTNNTALTITPVIGSFVSINDVSLLEGDSGTSSAVFTVTLSPAFSQTVYVNFDTANNTAAAPSDYAGASGVLTFLPGQTAHNLSVLINGDTNAEPNETFFVNLSGATNASISKAQGIGTIVNDDIGGSVGVFYDSRYVDTTSGGTSAEASNVVASLQYLNFQAGTFTDIGAAAATNRCVLFPELENSDLSAGLSPADQAALSNFVAQGGVMIVHGDSGYNAGRFLNRVFGLALVHTSGGSVYTRTAQAAGTPFADDPLSITFNNATTVLTTNSLPPGALSIYEAGSGLSAVTVLPRGLGAAVFLGWDWFDAAPLGSQNSGWLPVLATAAGLEPAWLSAVDISVAGGCSPGTVYVGQVFTNFLNLTNCGPHPASGLSVSNVLPASLSVLSVSCSQGTWSHAGNTYQFALGLLPSAASARISITTAATAPGSVTNLAFVAANEPDLNTVNNATATIATVLPPPVLAYLLTNQHLALSWPGGCILQSATNLPGPFVDVAGAPNPYVLDTTSAPRRFFRVRAP